MIGNTGGAGVSQFRWIRVGPSLLLRGAACDGKIVYGYPYRDAANALGRTVYRECGGDVGCGDCPQLPIASLSVAVSGFGLPPDFWPYADRANGNWTLESQAPTVKNGWGAWVYGQPFDATWVTVTVRCLTTHLQATWWAIVDVHWNFQTVTYASILSQTSPCDPPAGSTTFSPGGMLTIL